MIHLPWRFDLYPLARASRTSPQSFYGHHAAALVCAVAAQESLTIHMAADKMVLALVARAPRATGGRRGV